MKISKLKMQRFSLTIGMLLSLVCVGTLGLQAQTTTGNIRGYVTGPNGAPVSDAQVIVRMPSTNEVRGTTTNSAGFYYLAGLRPGTYQLTVRRVGLEPQNRPVTMRIGETLDLNVSTSEVAQTLATVEV